MTVTSPVVILLAGGFGCVKPTDPSQQLAAGTSSSPALGASQLLFSATAHGIKLQQQMDAFGAPLGGGHSPANVVVGGAPAIAHMLGALQGVRRLEPLAENLWVVCNKGDESHVSAALASSSVGEVSSSRIISNGVSSASQWRGDAADLRVGLQAAGTGRPVVAVSASVVLLPGYNLQRLVEHSIVRGRDTLGFMEVSDLDTMLLPRNQPQVCVEIAEASAPVPRLASIAVDPHGPVPSGSLVAQPFAFLWPSSLPAVLGSQATDIQGVVAELLQSGKEVCGVDMQQGCLGLGNQMAADYVDRLVDHLMRKQLGVLSYSKSAAAQLEERLHSLAATGRSLAATPDALATSLIEFHTGFFGDPLKASPTGQTYVLPSTFYMTAYRRQAAEIMK